MNDLSIVAVNRDDLSEWLDGPPWPVTRAILNACQLLMPEATLTTIEYGVVVTGAGAKFIFRNKDGYIVAASQHEGAAGVQAITGFIFSESPSARIRCGLVPGVPDDFAGTRKDLLMWMVASMHELRMPLPRG